MALAGTTVGSINHLKYPAYIYEKGWRSMQDAGRKRMDLALSVFGQFLIAVMIQVAAASALPGKGQEVKTLEDLARVFSATLGGYGRIAVGFGMWAAVFSSFIGSNTGYSLLAADIYERYIRPAPSAGRDAARQRAYRVLLAVFYLPSLYVLFTGWKPFPLVVLSSAAFLALMPLLMGGLLKLTTDRSLLGEHVNRPISNLLLGGMICLTLYLTWQNAAELIGR
jgi:Mn2+/Fe2+ NRAMP family transporter